MQLNGTNGYYGTSLKLAVCTFYFACSSVSAIHLNNNNYYYTAHCSQYWVSIEVARAPPWNGMKLNRR
jgi:hypothetical protein